MHSRLILASASPRRVELCRSAGLDVEVAPVGVEEPPRGRESPAHYALRMARKKAEAAAAGAARGGERGARVRRWAIGADTIVVVAGRRILGKPRDRADARRMLRLLAGGEHRVMTGVCVARAGGPRRSTVVETLVQFRHATDAEIERYLDGGEWRDKAGAYGFQGGAGALLIARIVGSPTNVIGLPMAELLALLEDLGVR